MKRRSFLQALGATISLTAVPLPALVFAPVPPPLLRIPKTGMTMKVTWDMQQEADWLRWCVEDAREAMDYLDRVHLEPHSEMTTYPLGIKIIDPRECKGTPDFDAWDYHRAMTRVVFTRDARTLRVQQLKDFPE